MAKSKVGSPAKVRQVADKLNKSLGLDSAGYDHLSAEDVEFRQIIEEVVDTKLDGTKRYGEEGWMTLGAKDVFVDINRKYTRLRSVLWDDKPIPSSEGITDTCMDLAVYAVLVLMAMRRDERYKDIMEKKIG